MTIFIALFLLIQAAASPSGSAPPTTPQAVQPAVPNTLADSQRREVIQNIATAAEERYVDPAGGAKIAAHLRKQFAAGVFDKHSDPIEFAAAITKSLREAVQDVHLRAVYEPNRATSTVQRVAAPSGTTPQGSGPRSFNRIDPRSEAQIARSNYGFEAAQRLDGNVGYLKITRFVPLDFSSKAAVSAMDFLGNSDAMVVDLRGNIGGSPDLVQQLISYFTGPEPVQLLAHYVRDTGSTNTMMSQAEVPGKRLTGKPLYVLIDRHSASSAEAFAYIVQRKRLGIVIGETSSGAGNGGNMVPAGSGISFFVPFAKVVDGPGWEQTGIKPHIAVDPDGAIAVAHKIALQRLVLDAEDPVVKREREWALELATLSQTSATSTVGLGDYVGKFGTRGFKVEEGRLFVVPAAGQPEELVRVSNDVFRLDNARYTFERNGTGGDEVVGVKVETLSGTETRAAKTT